jgi:DNA-binding MarR family transcriptional regulator
MDRTTLTAALKPLQRRGLVEVAVDPADQRGRVLVLTRVGRSVLAAAVPVWKRAHAQVEHLLVGTDLGLLRRRLRSLSS